MLDLQVPPMKRIAVDFDGTLVEEVWPGIGDWLPGAVDGLKRLAEEFDEVVIWTCRTAEVDTDEKTPRDNSDQLDAIWEMLDSAGIPINVRVWTRPYKPPADVYLDNKAIRFNGDWNVALAAVFGSMFDNKYLAYLNDQGDPGDEDDQGAMNTPADVIDQMERESWYEHRGGRIIPDLMLENPHSIRTFETGATRDTDDGKLDYEGFLSPLVLRRYAEYMHRHRYQSDGSLRSSDNWQKGIPLEAYMKSGWRHFMDWWGNHRGDAGGEDPDIEEALCALIFNASGYLHELLNSDH